MLTTVEDMFAALGAGDLRIGQVVNTVPQTSRACAAATRIAY